MIHKSWARCVRNFGLDPGRVHKPVVLTSTELNEYRDRADEIAWCAKGEVQRLYRRLGDLGYVILLTDDNGVTIDYLGKDSMRDVLRAAGLYLGAVWAEDNQGTNGVGTCLQEGVSLSVVMDDHFAAHNIGLTCTVAPIHGPDGDVRAVLDISTDRPTTREIQAVLRTVVENAARRIENNLFRRHHRPHWLLSLAPDPEVMDEADRAYLAVDDSGRMLAIDHRLRQLLAEDGKAGRPGPPHRRSHRADDGGYRPHRAPVVAGGAGRRRAVPVPVGAVVAGQAAGAHRAQTNPPASLVAGRGRAADARCAGRLGTVAAARGRRAQAPDP